MAQRRILIIKSAPWVAQWAHLLWESIVYKYTLINYIPVRPGRPKWERLSGCSKKTITYSKTSEWGGDSISNLQQRKMWRPAKRGPVSRAGALFPFIRDKRLSARDLAFWEQDGLGEWQKVDSHMGKVVERACTGFGSRNISMSTIPINNTVKNKGNLL